MPKDLSRYDQNPPPPVEVRPAITGDIGALTEILAQAFDDDPLSRYMLRGDRRRAIGLRKVFSAQLRNLIGDLSAPRGEVWTTLNSCSAALWIPPTSGARRWADMGQMLRILPTLMGGGQLSERLKLLGHIADARPSTPHWYLASIGTLPALQGAGWGSSLLASKLEQIDERGMPAYLESSKRKNLPFYARHGFEVTGEIREPGAPTIWLMWRKGVPTNDTPVL